MTYFKSFNSKPCLFVLALALQGHGVIQLLPPCPAMHNAWQRRHGWGKNLCPPNSGLLANRVAANGQGLLLWRYSLLVLPRTAAD